MRLSNLFLTPKTPRLNNSSHKASRSRIARLEALEQRTLLSLSPNTADYQALAKHSSLDQTEESAIVVTSLTDVVNANDGQITLREALDYASQTLSSGETVSSRIKFSLGGTIKLSSSNQSLKILSKSVDIDATDVGGITVTGQNSLLMYVFGGAVTSPVSVSLKGLTLTGGKTTGANAKGAAIQLSQYCNLAVDHCSIVNNTSTSGLGTGIYVGSGSLTLINSFIEGNVSTDASSKGGAVYVDMGTVTAIGSTFVGNASGVGGCIYAKGGTVTVEDCLFQNNHALSGEGGAIFATGSTIVLDNVGFVANESNDGGGAIYIDGEKDAELIDVKFIGNKGTTGGAVYHDSESLVIENVFFENNQATQNGGALYVGLNSAVQITQGTFYENKASNDGGAVYSDGSFFLTNGEFTSNESYRNGGALYSSYYCEIRSANFTNNIASNYGGSVYNNSETPSWLLNVSIKDSSSDEGAGVYNRGKLTIVDSLAEDNVAEANGGGFVNLGSLVLSKTTVVNNQALGVNGAGGGVLNYPNASMQILNSTLNNNSAPEGSGAAIANNGTVYITSTSVDNNVAGEFGGGIYNGGSLTAQNVTISRNVANNGGAFAATHGSSANLEGAALWKNQANINGGALYCYGATSFQSSVISYNVASTSTVAAYYCSGETGSIPKFDSQTTISNNVGISSIDPVQANTDLVVLDAETYASIEGGVYFGDLAVTDKPLVKSLIVKNVGNDILRLSDLVKTTNADNKTFTYVLTLEDGTELNLNSGVVLAPNESFYLQTVVTPNKTGAQVTSLTWSTDIINAQGDVIAQTRQKFSVFETVEITKTASATVRVSQLTDSDADVSFHEDGSVSVSLSKAPTENVILYLKTSANATLSTDVLLFTPSNYNTPQIVSVSVDPNIFRTNGTVSDVIEIQPQVISGLTGWNDSTFARATLDIKEYIGFIGENSVDLNQYATPGTTRWDLNGDGYTDAISYGDPLWIDASNVSSDTIYATQTRNGVTTTKEYDVPTLADIPTAASELVVFANVPGFARLSLSSEHETIQNWRVDWGDGSPLEEVNEISMSQIFSHCYVQDGQYNVSVEIVSSDGVGKGVWTTVGILNITNLEQTSRAVLELIEELSEAEFIVDDSINNLVQNRELIEQAECPTNDNAESSSSKCRSLPVESTVHDMFGQRKSKRLTTLF